MDGILDLELYTISMISLNNAFEIIDDNPQKAMEIFKDSTDNLQEFYDDVITDLQNDEMQFNEYNSFFRNGKSAFPQYIKLFEKEFEKNNNDDLKSLIRIFTNLNKIAEAFDNEKEDYYEF